jgi:hypothetical protein
VRENTISVLAKGHTRWPHQFEDWNLKYRPPKHFYLTVHYLWAATVGNDPDTYDGHLALSQIPVRHHDRNKWITALLAIGFWERIKAGRRGIGPERAGSLYNYVESTTDEAWERLFQVAAFYGNFRNWDKVTKERFAIVIRRAMAMAVDESSYPSSGFLISPKGG